MATIEEVLAKATEWEQAGNPENAAKLRAYAKTLQPTAPHDAATVEAKAAEWDQAGQPEKAAKLRAYAATLPKPVADGPVTADQAETPESEAAARAARFEAFEAANPALKGRYTPDNMPKAGDSVTGEGGGGRSGAARYTVQPWQNVKEDRFGDTAREMTEAPMAAAKQFAGGFTGGNPSPSRNFLANDPLTRNLPGPVLTGLGAVGDVGGAALSVIGAGISGGAGLVAEAVPGQNAQGEKKLAEDLTGMAMFAVPELAGASSVPTRIAAAGPKVAPVARTAQKVADDVAAAQRRGIPVMRSDVTPPKTAVGKIAQRVGESIPIAGTAGQRAKQFTARGEAVLDFIKEYAGDTVLPAVDRVTEALLSKRSVDLKRYTKMKTTVVNRLKEKGVVPVTGAVTEIDKQIAGLKAQKLGELAPVIAKLEDFKASLKDQSLDMIEQNRKAIGQAFADPGLASIRSTGEKALSAVYDPLRKDITAFVKAQGKPGDDAIWKKANEQLAAMAGDLKDTALKRVLSKGEMTPEAVRTMLFSQKPSDIQRLAKGLDDKGKGAARTAIVQEVIAKAGGIDNLSVDRFKNALDKMGAPVRVFFDDDHAEAAGGLLKALRLTEHASKAGAAPLTGAQNVPAGIILLVSSFTGGSLTGSAAVLGTIGGIARIYEATGVQRALRRLNKMQTPKAEATGMRMLESALREAGMPASAQAANSEPLPRAVGQN